MVLKNSLGALWTGFLETLLLEARPCVCAILSLVCRGIRPPCPSISAHWTVLPKEFTYKSKTPPDFYSFPSATQFPTLLCTQGHLQKKHLVTGEGRFPSSPGTVASPSPTALKGLVCLLLCLCTGTGTLSCSGHAGFMTSEHGAGGSGQAPQCVAP